MRGSLVQRYKGSWSLVLDLGYEQDPETGKSRRRQKWVSFRGTRKAAEGRLTELVRSANRGEFVEPSKLTLIEWLRDWLEKSVKPPLRRPATYAGYKGVVEHHIASSALALLPLQQLRASDLERYYADLKRSPSTVGVHHALLHSALKKAMRDQLVIRNVAALVQDRPRPLKDRGDARDHCWSAVEARRFLDAAKEAGPQSAALFALALDCGARKSELGGLRWSDVDLDAATITIAQQVTGMGAEPTFGPTKTGRVRTVSIGAETVVLLREHKRHQAEIHMRNRTTYHDFGLVFAKEVEDLQTPRATLGQPLQWNNIGQRLFAQVTRAAGVRRIKFHGLRHTSATLSLQTGTPVHVVAARLGHSKVEMTLNVYAHALPNQQQAAANRLAALLHG
jgi:integrase